MMVQKEQLEKKLINLRIQYRAFKERYHMFHKNSSDHVRMTDWLVKMELEQMQIERQLYELGSTHY